MRDEGHKNDNPNSYIITRALKREYYDIKRSKKV